MAWLEIERSGVYHIAFRIDNQKFKRSLRTKSEREAEARRHRLEENLRLVESGRLTIPDDCEISAFLLSDGKLNGSPKLRKIIRLGQLFEEYIQSLPEDAMEADSIRIAGIHMRHVARILGSRKTVRSISTEDIQNV